MKIFLIGSGNIATQLGISFKKSGHNIVFVYSPAFPHAKKLGKELKTNFSNKLDDVSKYPADVYMIAVKDDAIPGVVKKLPVFKNSFVIHTSGATDIAVLEKKFKNCGVLWQIQTIKAGTKINLRKIPMVIEANNPASVKKLKQLAHALSDKVYVYDSRQRKILHLAATLSNNFVNHLHVMTKKLLKKHHLPYELLAPLILSTAENGIEDPEKSQTGPAKRNDKKTMREHLKLLPDKYYKDVYRMISKGIQSV